MAVPPQSAAAAEVERLDRALRLVTFAGCLGMTWGTLVGSPVTTEFFRELGATPFQFGLLGGVPMLMLFMQYAGAWLANCVASRQRWFVILGVTHRLLYLPLACLPLLFPQVPGTVMVPLLIVLLAVSSGLGNAMGPIWLSWMGDLLPKRIVNRYWGTRQQFVTLTWTLCFVGLTIFTYLAADMPARVAFPILTAVGVTAGVIDILLFLKVHEPPNRILARRGLLDTLLEPLRHPQFQSLLPWSCGFAFSACFAAVFIQVFILEVLGLPVWQTNVIWCFMGLGSALVAKLWGRLADRHGHRPVLMICTSLKSCIMLTLVVVSPRWAIPVLAVTFFIDNMLNCGNAIAQNGFMLKCSPKENRPMFLGSVVALNGLAGGLGAIVGGWFLRLTEGVHVQFASFDWGNYHLLFIVSFFLRIACVPMAAWVQEPRSSPAGVVVGEILAMWPMRYVSYPVGLYRRWRSANDDAEDDPPPEAPRDK